MELIGVKESGNEVQGDLAEAIFLFGTKQGANRTIRAAGVWSGRGSI